MSFKKNKEGESSIQSLSKKQRAEIVDPTLTVIVSQAYTATITEETLITNPNSLSLFSGQIYHHITNVRAIKLNRLKEELAK